MPRLLRAIGALTIVIGLMLPAAVPVAAAEPHRPLPAFRPKFVTERGPGNEVDCLWASASMLVDKWTAGQIRVSKDRLRSLSGDKGGGSNFDHLQRALGKIGLPARMSPDGGDFVTWNELRKRLAAGGGAVLLGDYSRLPRYYGRWDPRFWRGGGANDNHAIYLDGYDARRDRVWVMDPLAPANWPGEWVPARYVRNYAWKTRGGGLWTLMTPAAQPAPFAGVELDAPVSFAGIDALHVLWPIAKAPKGWVQPGVDVETTMEAIEGLVPAPGETVVIAPPVSTMATDEAPLAASVSHADEMLHAMLPLPTAAGTYQVVTTLRERRFGRVVATTMLTLFVPGERRATVEASESPAPVLTGRFTFEAQVTNAGTVTWAEPEGAVNAPPEAYTPRNTTLMATWIPLDAGAASDLVGPITVKLDLLPLEPGEDATISGSIPTPAEAGRWGLLLDVVDEIDGSFAANGSRPATILVELVLPVGPAAPR